MKVFLCIKPNEKALENDRKSISSKHERLSFPTVAEARDYCRENGLKNMVIVIDHENGGELMTLFVRNPLGKQGEAEKLAIDKTAEWNGAMKEEAFQSVRDQTNGRRVLR